MREALELLEERGAAEIAHPGGTLLAHLRRVSGLLEQWGARPVLQAAGLCHAFYGTDGFATALGDVTRREELVAAIGGEAERLVYFYASCDRKFSYPRLRDGDFRDRFTRAVVVPPWPMRRDFAELTVANELDVFAHNEELRARYEDESLRLFASWNDLLSAPARKAAGIAG
ncbi:hypothetical protein SMC26_20055 [Actinomadura fulvescens]|uniref:DUF6817 domain-containing protein n=1 Tax=Actinomadura fulvescens TaxID=46160 RepID=A0ABN3PS35_9ACTN